MNMMITTRHLLYVLLLTLTLTPAATAEPELPGLPYGISLIDAGGPRSGIHILPLGATRRAMSEWQLEERNRIQGQLWHRTWQLPQTTEAKEFHQLMLDSWAQQGGRLLFHCKERSCGSSNHWANQVFGVKELYAPDDQQYFSALQWQYAEADHYIALYTVERANRRRYSHLLWIETEASQEVLPAGVALTALASGEPVFVPDGLTPEQKSVWLDRLQALLAEQAGWQLVIVGHYFGDGVGGETEVSEAKLQALKQSSETMASDWASALVKAGVPDERLTRFGLGPLGQQPGTPRKNGVVLFRLP